MRVAVAVCCLGLLAGMPAIAQIIPDPPSRIPAPLPPPPQPPIINGPLGQTPPPGVYVPPGLNTHGDRVASCSCSGRAGAV